MWWVATAVAAPEFVGAEAEQRKLAGRAWEAAIECAGWEAPAAPEVQLELVDPGGGFAGKAQINSLTGLIWIHLDPGKLTDSVLMHEVAHAWVHTGPPDLVEGRTNLLANCKADVIGNGAYYRDDGRWLKDMVPLMEWTNAENADAAERSDGYAASTRFFVALASFVPDQDLWPQQGLTTWEELEATFRDRSPEVDQVLNLLAQDVQAQMAALNDRDRDRILSIVEEIQGYNPRRRDSDGDGLPDGTKMPPRPDGAAYLPGDKLAHCSWHVFEPGAKVSWTLLGPYGPISVAPELLRPDGSLVRNPTFAEEPAWMLIDGSGVTASTHCQEDGDYLLLAEEPRYEALLAPLRALLPEPPDANRRDVHVGSIETFLSEETIYLGQPDLDRVDGLEPLARLVGLASQGKDEEAAALLHEIRYVPPPLPPPPPPDSAHALPPDGAWHCSGWTATPDTAFALASGDDREGRVLRALDPQARVVQGVGSAVLIWPEVGAGEPVPACAEQDDVVLLDAPASLHSKLFAALGGPAEVRVNADRTGIESGVVLISHAELAWVRKSGRYDVLAALVAILVDFADMDMDPDEKRLNEQLAIEVGEGVRHVELGP